MTVRDRTALALVAAGVVVLVAVAGAYGGWRAALGVVGVVFLVAGFALAIGEEPAPAEPDFPPDPREFR